MSDIEDFLFRVVCSSFPRAILSCIIGSCIGVWPVLPFILTIFAITLLRLPINAYQTFILVINSVMLRMNLKILILMLLPLVHMLFLLLLLPVGLIVTLGYFVGYTIRCVYCGDNWLQSFKDFPDGIKTYWNSHVAFVRDAIGMYGDPSGIPYNWDGNKYGLSFGLEKMLSCTILTLFGGVSSILFTVLMMTIKWIPLSFDSLYFLFNAYFEQNSFENIITFLPFFLLGIAFLLAMNPIVYIAIIVVVVFTALFRCPFIGIRENGIKYGFIECFNILKRLDNSTTLENGYLKLKILGAHTEYSYQTKVCNESSLVKQKTNEIINQYDERDGDVVCYWDLFIPKCTEMCAYLLRKQWIEKDDIKTGDHSAIQAITTVAVLNILVDSIRNDDGKYDDVVMCGSAVIATKNTRPKDDNIINYFWPLFMDIKDILKNNPDLIEHKNVDIMTAYISSCMLNKPMKLKSFLRKIKDNNFEGNEVVVTSLRELSSSLLIVKPMIDRLNLIFTA